MVFKRMEGFQCPEDVVATTGFGAQLLTEILRLFA